VSSLESLIDTLDADINANAVQHVREIIIVAHGTSEGLVPPVLNGATASNLAEFRHVTWRSLAFLQQDLDLPHDRFVALRKKRSRVVSKLNAESWITLRACRFGTSAEGMYALFSFFGGRANVYAPKEYQFFGPQPIMEGMRVESRLEVHEYLVRQRLLPHDLHTPLRKNKVVQSLVEPALFSERFEIVSTDAENRDASYQSHINTLNARSISPALKAIFADNEHMLSPKAWVRLESRNKAWRINDRLTLGEQPQVVQYEINESRTYETTSAGQGWRATISATVRRSREWLPIQLFLYQPENNLWRGRLFDLASYVETDTDPAQKSKHGALVDLLDSHAFANAGGIDIRELFGAEGIQLPPPPASTISGTGAARSGPWVIEVMEVGERYRVKLERRNTGAGDPGHSIAVYQLRSQTEEQLHHMKLMRGLGMIPDTPGTELPAYLDRFSIDDLTALIDHLRDPYRAEHSYYIDHAQQAIARKRDHFAWWQAQYGKVAAEQPLFNEPYGTLSQVETDDRNALVHPFRFNGIWQEVKASHPSPGSARTDLFLEENLWDKLRREHESRDGGDDLEPDSPFTDLDAMRELESQGLGFATEKSILETSNDPACEELKLALAKWKELQVAHVDVDEMKRRLALEVTPSGKTYFDHVSWLWDKVSTIMILDDLKDMVLLEDSLLVWAIEKIPNFRPTDFGTPGRLGALLRAYAVIDIPWTMWKKFLDEQMNTLKIEERRGMITAIRQRLRMLRKATFEPDFPNTELIMHPSEAVARYFAERRIDYSDRLEWIVDAESLQKGFAVGMTRSYSTGSEIIAHANEVIGDVLSTFDANDCRLKVLMDAGLINLTRMRAEIIRAIVDTLLDRIPKVG
jgi:hypothetical protein